MHYYTVYRDEDIVAFGTADECLKKLKLKNIRQFYAMVSKAKSGTYGHYHVVVEDVDKNLEEKYAR